MSSEVEICAFGLAPIKQENTSIPVDLIQARWHWPTTESMKRVDYTYVERRVPVHWVAAVNALIDNALVANGIDKEGTHKL